MSFRYISRHGGNQAYSSKFSYAGEQAQMICDELSEEEIYQAYMIYASLHGLNTSEESVRTRISRYLKDNQPDELIDDAIMAYAEDCIIAPPDVVVARWGSSRYYELDRSPHRLARHQTCTSWFENGCRFVRHADIPRLVHFWTAFECRDIQLPKKTPEAIRPSSLQHGTRLSFSQQPNQVVEVSHREWGVLGRLPKPLAESLHAEPMRHRRCLALVDQRESSYQPQSSDWTAAGAQTQPNASECKLLVTSGAADVSAIELVEYAAEAFLADRNKC